MKTIIDLTYDTVQVLRANGHLINGSDGNTYVNLPQWFKTTDTPNRMEVLYTDQLPESVQLFIREVSIKESLQRLVDLYIQSPYVMLMGEQWIEAFDDAVTALNYEI